MSVMYQVQGQVNVRANSPIEAVVGYLRSALGHDAEIKSDGVAFDYDASNPEIYKVEGVNCEDEAEVTVYAADERDAEGGDQ